MSNLINLFIWVLIGILGIGILFEIHRIETSLRDNYNLQSTERN